MLQQGKLNIELNTNSMANQKPQKAFEGTPQYQYCAVKGHGAACKQHDTGADACGDEVQTPCGRVSDTHLASRKANEAGMWTVFQESLF